MNFVRSLILYFAWEISEERSGVFTDCVGSGVFKVFCVGIQGVPSFRRKKNPADSANRTQGTEDRTQ